MNILLIGSGGREHALAWKMKQSPLCNDLVIAPGNAGTAMCGTNLDIAVTDFAGLADACIFHAIDLVMVGPEEPLVKGIYDHFKNNDLTSHIQVIAPSAKAAQLEGSKSFAKAFMNTYNIPTAGYAEFSLENYMEGINYIQSHSLPVVLKADGLAAGKGVVISTNKLEALAEYELMVQKAKFGEAGKKVVIEEFLDGIELSVFVLTDGKHYLLLPEAKDYKRIGEGDTGPNTGGMGAVSPVPFADAGFIEKVKTRIIEPTLKGLEKEQMEYHGFIFIGLMNVKGEPFVIEYNCRLGDPETEVILPRMQCDLVEMLFAASQQRLNEIKWTVDPRCAATVVAASGGYPGEYIRGKIINGLDQVLSEESIIFLAGAKTDDDEIINTGGRVLTVTSFGEDINSAVRKSNQVLNKIHFNGMYYRSDIGYEFSAWTPATHNV